MRHEWRIIGGIYGGNPGKRKSPVPFKKGHGGSIRWYESMGSFRMKTGYCLRSSTAVTADIAEEHSIMTRIIRTSAMAFSTPQATQA